MQKLEQVIDKETRFRAFLPGSGASREGTRRLLVPVKQISDVEAALEYLLTLDHGADVHLAFLHVTSSSGAVSSGTYPGYAEKLLEQAESLCRADAIAYESHILAGDVVFSILDAAELLTCDAIVMPCVKRWRWRHFFSTETVRKVEQLSRDVPLVLIDAAGTVIRNKKS
jgi:nucleotide-binding universal stress UspA family protein